MQDLEKKFSDIEKKVLELQQRYLSTNAQLKKIQDEHKTLKKKWEDKQLENQVLAEENKNLKMQSAISGNTEHNQLMKNHINRLVKEIDLCITQLQNTGL